MIVSFGNKETKKIWLGEVSLKLAREIQDIYYSIRINKQWRIIFKWESGNCLNVEITDYH